MKITVTPQGPYVVSGSTPVGRARAVTTEQDEPLAWEHDAPLDASETYALCRCGGSSNKPFCDGTHAEKDWDGTETAPTVVVGGRTAACGEITLRSVRSSSSSKVWIGGDTISGSRMLRLSGPA